MPESVDILFLSYYADIDRWHNDWSSDVTRMPARAAQPGERDQSMMGRIERQSVRIDGRPYDFARFLSWARYGSTREFRRYDAYTPTHLNGAYHESLLGAKGLRVRHVNYADRLVIAELAERYSPRFVLFSTTFMIEAPTILDGMQRVRRAFPGARVISGGFMLGELEKDLGRPRFERFLRAWGADAYVASAMGEEPLLALLGADERDWPKLALANTWLRRADGGYTPPTPDVPELGLSMNDTWVRWDRLDPENLYHTVHVRTARSCTFKCSFCSLFVLEGELSNARPETLRAELESLKRVGHVRSVIFTDDTFNVPQRRFKELVRVLADFDFEWYSFYRSQFADHETVRMMKDSGCKGLFLGIESIDDEVLKIMNKATTVASYERGLEQLAKHEIPYHANFIIGFPGDRPENTARIVDFVDKWDMPFYSVSPWFCAPSTTITHEREKYGIEGNYYDWRHFTMDSKLAIELEQWMIRQPKRAVYMSQLSADAFWSEIMLYANGWSVAEARSAAQLFNRLAGADTPAATIRALPEAAHLTMLLTSKPLPEPAPHDRFTSGSSDKVLAADAAAP
ncbi:MAG: radical SAM protein [Planctomycetes bacterium]|nr:radical SAM protein [Planctomycetota bacterium]